MSSAAKYGGAAIFAFSGVTFLGLTLAAMNREAEGPKEVAATEIELFQPQQKKKPPKRKKVERPKPKPKPSRRPRAPAPQLSSNLAGLGAGVPLFDAGDLGDMGDSLLGADSGKDLVMTADSVDQQAQLDTSQCRIQPPKRAQAQGLSGTIEIRLIIGKDGRVKNAKVSEATIPDWWQQEVLATVRNCPFTAAVYQGQTVQQTVTLPIRFAKPS